MKFNRAAMLISALLPVFVSVSSACLLSAVVLPGCKSSPKRTTPELSRLEGKKVALIEIEGEASARAVVETSLINQLVQRGTFEVVTKQDVQKARDFYAQNPTDSAGIAKRAGADYALKATVLTFDATTHNGYSDEDVLDSEWEKDTGEKKRKNVYKVKSLVAKVRVQLDFTDVNTLETRTAVAEDEESVTGEANREAIHLPPPLRFLETTCNAAFKKFFDQYR
ncbi:MAG: hypothetical protein H7222_11800 [Methylotenera sp.]|nr:hypothetical protein [Oligoflexia bacterium]